MSAGLRLHRLELRVPDLKRSRDFYTRAWGLTVVAEEAGTSVDLLSEAGRDGGVVLRAASEPALGSLCFAVDNSEDAELLARRIEAAGGRVARSPRIDAKGAYAIEAEGPEGLRIAVSIAPAQPGIAIADPSKPLCLTHVVLNTSDVGMQTEFFRSALGFRVSDVTGRMTFLRCGRDHHSIALAKADKLSLNHAAFEMTDIDGLMYGAGRMIEHGHPIEWGPGRHGPGNNVFCYFIDPDGFAVEYTTGMEQVDDDTHVARDARYWESFPRRPCRWGVARKPSDRLATAFSGRGIVA